jgi:hypothetical protein
MRLQLIVIQRSSGLYLNPLGEGDDHRFAALFRCTWKQIDLRSRRCMVKHWRENHFRPKRAMWNPLVELHSRLDGDAAGLCSRVGHWLRFSNEVVAKTDDDTVCDLIAHELAHSFQATCGQWSHPLEVMEEGAEQIAAGWGFSPKPMHAWIRRFCVDQLLKD